MKKRIMMLIAASIVLSLCACGSKAADPSGAKDDSFTAAVESEKNAADSIVVVSDTQSEDVTDGQEELGTEYDYNAAGMSDAIDFTEYNGFKWICDYDGSSVTFNSATENGCDAVFDIVKDESVDSGFYKGTVELDASQVTAGNNKFYIRGVSSTDNKVSVDIDINPDGTMLVALYRDDGRYATSNLVCQELVEKITEKVSNDDVHLDLWYIDKMLVNDEGEYCILSSPDENGFPTHMKFKGCWMNSHQEVILGAGYGETFWVEGSCTIKNKIPSQYWLDEQISFEYAASYVDKPEHIGIFCGMFHDSEGNSLYVEIGNGD